MKTLTAAIVFLGAASLAAQDAPIPPGAVNINLPDNSPLSLQSISMADSRATARGAALALDLHMSATLRNNGPHRIHGVTLRVVAQEVTLGGKGSVTYPSLNVGPGEAFQVRIEMQLMRPSQVTGGPLVQVDLDGVLFQDLSFFGPDRLNSRRTMTACAMEAQRDREHFRRILAQGGPVGLQREMLESMARQSEVSQLAVTVKRTGRAVTSAATGPEHTAEFAFLQFPDSPVEPLNGSARISGNEARTPRIEVRNKSSQPVKYVEMGWIVSDPSGKQYMAGSLPSADSDLVLPPGRSARLLQETTLSFSAKGQPVSVRKMVGFVNQVEFADGKIWVPNRQNLENELLLKVLPPSAEVQRLTDLYRKRGIDALAAELGKF
ncbi:MAG: hypothetical protein NTW28_14570 [Candidatus Solibacter sp.]|nr:hypothetical protein [Candidatus Solibacter sp.]